MRWVLIAGFAFVFGVLFLVDAPGKVSAPPAGMTEATVGAIVDKSGKRLQLGDDKPVAVGESAAAMLAGLSPGDAVFYKKDSDGIAALAVKQYAVGYVGAIGALLVAFSLIWAVILVLTGGHPWAFAMGIDCRLSNSQSQFYLWFIAFTAVYLAELGLRFGFTHYLGGIGVPTKLLLLSGVSALTFGAARANTTVKVALSSAADPKPRPRHPRSRWSHLADLVTSDTGGFDLGDFQMIALTGLAILIYVSLSVAALAQLGYAAHVELPPVDDAVLGGTAATQGVYLLKKLVSPLGH
jgi:hypothetical protein